MEPVVTVNLNGNPYSLDQSAHEALKAYLDHAEAALASNPDKAEIVRDLEQAIADKLRAYLSAHKTVISASEMQKALGEMGPVEGDASEGAQASSGAAPKSEAGDKRLYRIPEGAVIAGICSGLAAYFSVDVTIIRILMVIGGIFSGGWLLLGYVIAMFVIPTAHTSAEWAAAHGIPFNAQEVIDQAKRQYGDFAQYGPPWRWQRSTRRAWKRAMRERVRAGAYAWDMPPRAPVGPVSYTGRIIGGTLAVLIGIVRVVLAIVFISLIVSLATTGSLGYWTLPSHVHVWQAIIVLIAVYAIISIPLRALRWGAYSLAGWRPYYGGYGYHGGGEGFFALVAIFFAGWFAYANIPEAHVWMDQTRDVIQHTIEDIRHANGS